MSEFVAACPYCGEQPFVDWECESHATVTAECLNNKCDNESILDLGFWNTRPLEDVLRKQLKKAEDQITRLIGLTPKP